MTKKTAYISELASSKQKAIIVSRQSTLFEKKLKDYLQKHDIDVFVSPVISSTQIFHYYFIITRKFQFLPLNTKPNAKITYILLDPEKKTCRNTTFPKDVHIVRIFGDEHFAQTQIEHIVWFAHSSQKTNRILTLESTLPLQKKTSPVPFPKKPSLFTAYRFPIRTVIVSLCISIILFLIAFLIPLSISSYLSYKTMSAIQQRSYKIAYQYMKLQEKAITISEIMYKPVSPLYLLFSLSRIPDDVLFINKLIAKGFVIATKLQEDMLFFSDLILRPNKLPSQIELTKQTFRKTVASLDEIEEIIVLITQKVPIALLTSHQKQSLNAFVAYIRKLKKAYRFLPTILGAEKKQKILLLFANNMELRPGGGFIGSFGILSTNTFGIEKLDILDVYDADGQLQAHVEPPLPIRTYLRQPHWFLRDSAFFPDFVDTYKQASFFLEKEMNQTNWDGCILITTSAVRDIIDAFSTITLPDFNENITKDNFYIKTQYYAEHSFFPGSTQKKSFLSALVNQLLINVQKADALKLTTALFNALDQKNIVAYMEDPSLQSFLNDYYWSGRMAQPTCATNASNCLNDFQFVLDANLGVNKANFFVDRTYTTDLTINDANFLQSTITLVYKNNSLKDMFPGGTYANYLQIIVPLQALVRSVTLDGTRFDFYDTETADYYKTIGLFVQIAPQESKTVRLQYQLPTSFKKGKATYQLVIQKQIGAPSSDLKLTMQFPNQAQLLNLNFSPLVNQNQIIYNTDLATDRVFFIEFLKE